MCLGQKLSVSYKVKERTGLCKFCRICVAELHSDISEKSKVDKFLSITCGCKLGKKQKPCCSSFSEEEVLEIRANFLEMDSNELDVVILGIISTSTRKSSSHKRL